MTAFSMIILARVLHVISSTAWAGFVIIAAITLVTVPGSAEGREGRHVRRSVINRAARIVAPAALMSLLSGLYLFSKLHAGLNTPAEVALKTGAACAVLSFFFGAIGSGSAERQLAHLDDLASPSSEQIDRIRTLNRRVVIVARITAALLIVSGATMAAARLL